MMIFIFFSCIKVIIADALCSCHIGFTLECSDTLSKLNNKIEIDVHLIIFFIMYTMYIDIIVFANVCVTVQGHVWMWRPGLSIRYFPTLLSTLIKNILYFKIQI